MKKERPTFPRVAFSSTLSASISHPLIPDLSKASTAHGRIVAQWLFGHRLFRQLVPDDHVLARVDRVLDLSWLRDEVADLYCADNGRPGIDPEVAVRLMLAGFLLGIINDRRLIVEGQVNLALQ